MNTFVKLALVATRIELLAASVTFLLLFGAGWQMVLAQPVLPQTGSEYLATWASLIIASASTLALVGIAALGVVRFWFLITADARRMLGQATRPYERSGIAFVAHLIK